MNPQALTIPDNREQQLTDLVGLICESADRREMPPCQRDQPTEIEIREIAAQSAARLHLTLYEEHDWLWGQIRDRCEILALGLMDDEFPKPMPDPGEWAELMEATLPDEDYGPIPLNPAVVLVCCLIGGVACVALALGWW